MQALLTVFWDIALWRRGPRDLPPSRGLLAVTAVLYLVTSAIQSLLVDGPALAAVRGVADLAFTAAVFWLCLAIGRRGHRLLQTLIAVFGTGTLLSLPMIAVFVAAAAAGADGPAGRAIELLLLPLLVWGLAVLAHIVRRALEAPLVTGVAVASSYYLAGYFLLERLLPAMVN
jgi:hypothetical protein